MSSWSNQIVRVFIAFVLSAVAPAIGMPIESAAQNSSADTLTFRQAMLAAEDSRAADPVSLATLLTGIESPNEEIQKIAVRALGRLERFNMSDRIARLLEADQPAVRREAVNALGQSLQRGGDLSAYVSMLLARLENERDPEVRGVIAETLGRLPYLDSQTLQRVELILGSFTSSVEPAIRLGAVDGLEAIARLRGDQTPLAAQTIAQLRAALTTSGSDERALWTRRLALAALNVSGAASAETITVALDDSDAQTRRLAALALLNADDLPERQVLIAKALTDRSAMVRLEALVAYGEHGRLMGCAPIVDAVGDQNSHVSLRALDLLGEDCPTVPSLTSFVASIAGGLNSDGDWHRPAHALVTLAQLNQSRAAGLVSRFVEHPVWQVRMYGARAATQLGPASGVILAELANDPHANVRGAALRGLVELAGHAADDVLLQALASDDYGLLRTVASLLRGSPDRRAPTILLSTLARLTAADRDTSRDARVAILQRLKELGSRRNAGVLRPYLEDPDPRVAATAAEALSDWTDQTVTARTSRLRTGTSPSLEAVLGLVSAHVRMVNGAEFQLKLFPEEAPATVERFSQLARKGYYDTLTFHRVVPNFVIQGGSPGANEFMGDGPYMRDELGLRPHVRGAVGISTRGRDTGDAQIFINLVDNPRLDHNFTVFAQVTTGMDAVDAILEGDAIDRIEIIER